VAPAVEAATASNKTTSPERLFCKTDHRLAPETAGIVNAARENGLVASDEAEFFTKAG
jgi:hypothetical protein